MNWVFVLVSAVASTQRVQGWTLFSALLMTAFVSTIGYAQSPLNPPKDFIARAVSDSMQLTAPPRPVTPNQGWRICGDRTRWHCAFLGAVTLGALGSLVGEAVSPKPKYESAGLVFRGDTCTANCGIPHKAVVFALGGSAIGGLAGWLIGRE